MKIVYCINSIKGLGGIQKVTMVKANALSDDYGQEVYIVVTDNKAERQLIPVSPNVKVIDLDVNYYKSDYKSKFHLLYAIFVKGFRHYRRLRKTLRELQPDVVISVGQSEKHFVPMIKGEWMRIREFHFVRNYRAQAASSTLGKIVAKIADLIDKFTLKRYDKIIVLTREDKDANWVGWESVAVMPNPIEKEVSIRSTLNSKKLIAVGRLSDQKNFASLIRAFKLVADKHPDWQLEIWGDGDQKEMLQHLLDDLGLEGKVKLCGFTNDIGKVLCESSIMAVSSKFEGFPLSIIEAMSYGVPVVSYQCPCGPADIIDDGINGFLVPLGDEKALADRLCMLIEDVSLRQQMGASAVEKAMTFSLNNIIPKWLEIFETAYTIRK